MNSLCNVGLCFNPCAQQNSFCLGRLALIRPAVVQPFRLRRAQPAPARALARQRASMASLFSLVPLHRRSKPTLCLPRSELRSAAVGRVFLSAFAQQKPHSFPRGKPPASGPLPPSANTPHPFSPKLSRFVCWRHKPRQPRVSANLCCGVFHSRAEPDENPSSNTRKGFLWAQLFRSHEQPFLAAVPPLTSASETSAAVASSPFRLPCRGCGMLGSRISPCGDSTPRRYSVPLYRLSAAKFPPEPQGERGRREVAATKRSEVATLGNFSSNLWNFQSLEIANRQSAIPLGPPLRAPP
jgi:hypothetical protein